MMLSDQDIYRAQAMGWIGINPFDPLMLQPASVDLRLSDSFHIFGKSMKNATGDYESQDVTEKHDAYYLRPGEFILGSTVEAITLDRQHAAQLMGKSSLGRKGLIVHVTAGFVDPGFAGPLTLELTNISKRAIVLTAEMPVAQIAFFKLSSPVTNTYSGHYQHQQGATPAWT